MESTLLRIKRVKIWSDPVGDYKRCCLLNKRTSRVCVASILDNMKVSLEYIWGRDTNQECAEYLNSAKSVINTDLRFMTGSGLYLTDLTLHNLTRS